MHGIHSETNIKNVMHGTYLMAAPDLLDVILKGIATQFKGNEWWFTGGLALAISGLVAGLGWMIAEFLRNSEIKAWSKKEIEEFITTVIIFSAIFFIVPLMAEVVNAFTKENYFTVAKNFMYNDLQPEKGLYSVVLKIANSITSMITVLLVLAGTSLDLVKFLTQVAKLISVVSGPGGIVLTQIAGFLAGSFVSATIPWGLVFLNVWSALSVLLSVSYAVVGLAYGQYLLLDFFEKTMFTFILPIGVVMRAFPMTRKTGSSLIAIAIVGYLVYPMTVVLGKGIYDEAAKSFPLVLPREVYLLASTNENVLLEIPPSPQLSKSLSKDDILTWSVMKKGTGVYRVWAATERDVCFRYKNENPDSQPPLEASLNTWPITMPGPNDPSFNCYKVIKTAPYDSRQPIEVKVSEFVTKPEDEDLEWQIAVDAYEHTSDGFKPIGFNRDAVYAVGDPCKKHWWSKYTCKLEKASSGTVGRTAIAIGEGFIGGIRDLATKGFFPNERPAHATARLALILTPWTFASDTFLDLTDSSVLPGLLFPSFMVLLNFVVSLIVSVSAYRSIAEAIGGEPQLPGLARMM
jgi:hypothetical protein